jgi:hypothetical protein
LGCGGGALDGDRGAIATLVVFFGVREKENPVLYFEFSSSAAGGPSADMSASNLGGEAPIYNK